MRRRWVSRAHGDGREPQRPAVDESLSRVVGYQQLADRFLRAA